MILYPCKSCKHNIPNELHETTLSLWKFVYATLICGAVHACALMGVKDRHMSNNVVVPYCLQQIVLIRQTHWGNRGHLMDHRAVWRLSMFASKVEWILYCQQYCKSIFSLFRVLWWITSGNLKLTKNETDVCIALMHPSIFFLFYISWRLKNNFCALVQILWDEADQAATTKLTSKNDTDWPLWSHFSFSVCSHFIRHQQKSPSRRFVSAGTLASDQTSFSSLNAIFKLLSAKQIVNGSNMNPNRKSK